MRPGSFLGLLDQKCRGTNFITGKIETLDGSIFCKESDVFMAALIVQETLMPHLSDEEFSKTILMRDEKGQVTLNEKQIPSMYSCLLPILLRCLDNDYTKRPRASDVLHFMETTRTSIINLLPTFCP